MLSTAPIAQARGGGPRGLAEEVGKEEASAAHIEAPAATAGGEAVTATAASVVAHALVKVRPSNFWQLRGGGGAETSSAAELVAVARYANCRATRNPQIQVLRRMIWFRVSELRSKCTEIVN